ncbi:hypothetical protein [Campylobacter concisus]|nr:hypothetical protein [Campylobacter concisus]
MLSEPVSATIIIATIVAVVVVSLFGIFLVNKLKDKNSGNFKRSFEIFS